jgi:protein-L-isoaspartate(D-aspartate) O-methyltransferase
MHWTEISVLTSHLSELMAIDLTAQRRFFAEEIETICNLRTPALVEALATVAREAFLRPGPWVIRGEADLMGPARQTPDDHPRRVYHNLSIAIDPARQLFNGAPGIVSVAIDALGLRAGQRVLHVGCGLGYYSAVIAHTVGQDGRVIAIDVDEALASEARDKLASRRWVEVRHGNGVDLANEIYDAILVNAGTTHPHEAWLAALAPGGRLVLPLTFTMDAMGPIGKGVLALVTSTADRNVYDARPVAPIAVYSAIGIRDAALNDKLREAFTRSFWPSFKTLRRDPHEAQPSCWLHGERFCLSA